MKKFIVITYSLLLFLTITTAIVAQSTLLTGYALYLIMGIAFAKFMLVAFEFMELKKAHSFWKTSVILVVLLLVVLIVLLF